MTFLEILEVASNATVLLAGAKFLWSKRTTKFTFSLPEGERTITMKAGDVNPQSLTNAVSAAFFNGGQVSPAVRTAIIGATSPKYQAK